MSNATSPAAAALSASARVRVAARCLGCARAQHDSGRRYLCFRLVRRRQRFQLLVRWVNRGGRDRRCPNSSCTPRDANQGGSRDVGRQHCTRRVCMAFARTCCWSAVLDRVDSAPTILLLGNELLRQLAQSPVLWFTFGSLAASHFWKAFRVGCDTMPDKELKQRVR